MAKNPSIHNHRTVVRQAREAARETKDGAAAVAIEGLLAALKDVTGTALAHTGTLEDDRIGRADYLAGDEDEVAEAEQLIADRKALSALSKVL